VGDDSHDSILRQVAAAPPLRARARLVAVLVARAEDAQSLLHAMRGHGGELEARDGDVCVVFGPDATLATAASFALRVAIPTARFALCRGEVAIPAHRDALVERARALLPESPGVAIDDMTASGLDARFEVRKVATRWLLVGERSSAGSSTDESLAPPVALARHGLRFASDELEADYRVWHTQRAIPFVRSVLAASGIGQVAGLVMVRIAEPDAVLSATVAILAIVPLQAFAIVFSYRPELVRWVLPCTVVINVQYGLTAVWIVFRWLDMPQLSAGFAIAVLFFGATQFRLRTAAAIVAVTPYVVLDQVLFASGFAAGRIDQASFVCSSIFLWIVLANTIYMCITNDRISRDAYRQERLVEEQRRIIERERARADVAERARQLAESLLRIDAAPHGPERPAPDDVIDGRYRVVRPIGVGGMGEVHEVERLTDGRRLALKVLTGRTDRAALARFAREARIASELKHPNVVAALDVGVTSKGTLFLVMELVTGASIAGMRDRYGDATWAAAILGQLARALVAMHERGIIHRDLKPSNLLLDGTAVKVADFGLASLREPANPEADTALDVGLTRTGAVMGTPFYMAPELIAGASHASPASDMFSLGVIAYELLAKQLPRVLPARPLHELCPELAGELADLVHRCLAQAPKDRPAAGDFVAVLR
jgi:Protein kinase domain